jgi:two-component system sensor histidine kinase CiaH
MLPAGFSISRVVRRGRSGRRAETAQRAHSARVALAASLLVCVVYAACAAALHMAVSTRLVAEVTARLQERLSDIGEAGFSPASIEADDIGTSPVFVWRLAARGPAGGPQLWAAVSGSGTPPQLPADAHAMAEGSSRTVLAGAQPYRLYAGRAAGQRLIVGESLVPTYHLLALLRDGEALVAPVLLLAMFVGAFTIGQRALAPVEQSRRRQLEFTADASHELRTPLAVITAETGIALSADRDATAYRAALVRIDGESRRLDRIVDDMLWLARFDSAPPQPRHEPLDLATIAAECATRFQALATAQDVTIVISATGSGPAWISAPPESIDRLAGVLADNACRYAGPGGTVRVSVAPRGGRVCLTVEDSGPGIPPEDQDRLFDRFHRSTELGGSAGLGLAIADSIVRSTGGQWRLDTSDLGGALFEVSWRRAGPHRHAPGVAGRFGPALPGGPGRPAPPAPASDTRT